MARVWNPTEEKVETKIFGAYFSFAPGQFKNMSAHHADFIKMNRKETGLVVLTPQFDPMDEDNYIEGFDKSTEGKQILLEKKKEGIENLLDFYSQIVYNNQVSLRNDLAHRDPHTDPVKLSAINASKGELEAMRLVSKYQKLKLDDQASKVREVERLMSEVGPIGK